jgi:hypothetical protein
MMIELQVMLAVALMVFVAAVAALGVAVTVVYLLYSIVMLTLAALGFEV